MSYTGLCVLGLTVTLLLDLAVLRTRLVLRRIFWTSYAIMLGFQLLTNAWLTGRGIVRYDDSAVLGLRLAYAPVEDILFGFSLITQSLVWWVWWGRRRAGHGERGPMPAGPPRADGGSTHRPVG